MIALMAALPRWALMWLLAGAIFAACKLLTWWPHRRKAGAARSMGYLFLWPGMDARAFLDPALRPAAPRALDWVFATAKTLFGIALLAFAPQGPPLVRGWVGLAGMIFVLHFGTFHLVALLWKRFGVQAEPIMRAPILARSLGDFWGHRWNRGFHNLAHDHLYQRLAPKAGRAAAVMAVFLASGLVHDLVISVPAGGGYGLPSAYFALQGLGVLIERSAAGKDFGLGHGIAGRIFMAAFTAGPAYALFHPPFVREVIIPFMADLGIA